MKVLSLFDGMACGMLAMQMAGIEVDRYVAYEYDETSANVAKGRPYGYAALTASHNFPMIEQKGDVFQADFTEYSGFDFLIGGSPCTYWSIAQKNNRETEASGMGWELFSQYVRALHEANPKFFVYENNKSMSKAIRESIDKAFGFEAIGINSALVSAQNRQRLYWVGKRNEDGTYSKAPIEQPEDLGILLKDILESSQAPCNPSVTGKARPVHAGYSRLECQKWYDRVYSDNPNKQQHDYVAEPVCMRYERTDEAKAVRKQYEAGEIKHGFHELHELHPRMDGKTNTLSTVLKDNPICEPVRVGTWPNNAKNQAHDSQQYRIYSPEGKSVTLCGNGGGMGAKTGLYAIPCCNMIVKEATKKGYTEIEPMACVDMTQPNSQTRRGRNMADKSNCCMTSCQHYQYCGVLAYATPCEWDDDGKVTKAVSCADGKTYAVYEVKDGKITIKGKQYPIKLVDGFYIIRKLTVRECMRLQTVPDWYEFPVSDSQAYKMLGNGWTVEVIAHLLKGVCK